MSEYLLIMILIYFLPTGIAIGRKGRDGIIALNILLGWTLIGWVAALVWALAAEKTGDKRFGLGWVAIGLGVILFAASIFGTSNNGTTTKPASSPQAPRSNKSETRSIRHIKPAITTTAHRLYSDYKSNAVAADRKYKDKILRVSGVVDTINRDILQTIYVVLSGDDYFGGVQCFFSDDYEKAIANLRKGQAITIKGKCDGKLMNVLLKECIIEQ